MGRINCMPKVWEEGRQSIGRNSQESAKHSNILYPSDPPQKSCKIGSFEGKRP